MKLTVVVGAQWGDEGKGKLVDVLAAGYDVVGRFNGGNNAGHTIIYKGKQCKLHILPSGIFQRKKLIIAQGAVFDPEVLLTELTFCQKCQIPLDLLIDYRVNLVMPYHQLMDSGSEARKGKRATGSLNLGIGYCYEDRNNRAGIRCEDLFYPAILKQKLSQLLPLKRAILTKAYGLRVQLSGAAIFRRLMFFRRLLKPYIGDVAGFVASNLDKKSMLFEGAMGTMLDGNFGTYPFTVANNTIASSLFSYVGIPQAPLTVIAAVKAYTTRVGGGPFATEQNNSFGDRLQRIGQEFGATSGRKRRCGWLDLAVVRFAHRLNGFSQLVITKLDVLSELDPIPVCTGYRLDGKIFKEYPGVSHAYCRVKPVYKMLKGWKKPIAAVRNITNLPKEAKNYLSFIEKEVGVPVTYVSVGPDRDAIIRL